MSDVNITMGVDNTSALQSLKQVENGVNRLAKVFGKLNGATANISIDTSKSMKAINDLQSKLGDIATKITGSIKLDNSDAIKAINEVQSKISGLSTSVNSKVKIDNSAAIQAVNQLQNSIDQLTTGLNASVKIDNNDALNNIKDVYSRLNALNSVTTTRVNIDTTKAEDNLAKLKWENSAIASMLRQKNKVQVDTSSAEKSLKDLGGAARTAGGGFSVLGTAIAALGLSTLIQNAGALATTITNLSGSTSIGITSIKSYADAISSAGGDARGAVEDLTDLTRSIDDARKGNGDAQISFAKIGISLSDLSKLSEEDIFKKTVMGLANIQDASKRSTMSMALLGGEMKKVDIQSVARSMTTNGSGGADVSAIMASAEAQKAMARNIANLGNAIINVIKPLNELVKQIDIGTKSFEQFIKAAALLLGIFAAFKIASKITAAMVGVTESVAAAGGVIRAIFGNIVADFKLIVAAFSRSTVGPWWGRVIAAVGGVLGLVARFAGVTGTVYALAQAIDWLVEKFTGFSIIEKVIVWIKELNKQIGELITIGDALNVSPLMKMASMIDLSKLKEMAGLTKEIADSSKTKPAAYQADIRAIDNKTVTNDTDKKDKQVISAQRGIRLELMKTLISYQDQNAEMKRAADFANSLIGIDEVSANRKQKLFDIETNRLSLIKSITNQYEEMKRAAAVGGDEEKNAFAAFSAVYLEFQRKINVEAAGHKASMEAILTVEEKLKSIEQARLDIIQQIVDAEIRRNAVTTATNSAFSDLFSKIRDSKSEIELALLSPLERQREEIRKNARLIEEEMVKKLTEAFSNEEGDIIDPEKLGAQIQKARAMIDDLKNTQLGALEASQTWSSGWNTAFNEYVDSATNAANMAKDAFSSFTSNLDTMIDTFVSTGKLSFRDFARSVIADLVKIELKAQTMKLLQMLPGGGIGGMMGSLSSLIGGGGSTAASGFGTGAAYGSMDLGGFFADGGQPPLNKASIVGEKGPELFVPKSAGTIIPNGQFGGGGNQIVNNYNTYVTNSVSAIDAKSVAQLFQENRKTLLGVTEQAKKEMPGRSR